MSIEAGVLVAVDGTALYWHTPKGASAASLPDSPDLWDVIWKHRKVLYGFAHTHPGRGVPAPSTTDLTTFAAVEAGLGTRLMWWILTQDRGIVLHWDDQKKSYEIVKETPDGQPWPEPWMGSLRQMSLSSEEIAVIERRQLVEGIRHKLMALSPAQRVLALIGTHICLDCGEDLRVFHFTHDDGPSAAVCRCTRDE